MHKEATIRKQGDQYRVLFRNYMGPYEAKLIAKRLELEETKAPSEGPSENGLSNRQYYTWELMSRHPELYALLGADQLEECAKVIRDFHMEVTEGKELLPEVAPIEQEHHESYVQVIESRHQSVLARGPKALLSAFLVRAIPALVVLVILVIASRHFGDHHQNVTLETMFVRAGKAPVQQSAWAGLINPDHSRSVRAQIRGVKFLESNRMIFIDGNFIEVTSVDDLRPLFKLAQAAAVAPAIEATIVDGAIHVDRISYGGEVFATGGEIVRLARFDASVNEPQRSIHENPNVFQQFRKLAHDDAEVLEPLVGRRIALVGHVKDEDGQRVLRMEDGTGVVLKPVRYAKKLDEFLELFTGDAATLQVDMVPDNIYRWTNKKDPSTSRQDTKLIGEADVYSASAHNFHVVGRR